jgi:hypothetical protein
MNSAMPWEGRCGDTHEPQPQAMEKPRQPGCHVPAWPLWRKILFDAIVMGDMPGEVGVGVHVTEAC